MLILLKDIIQSAVLPVQEHLPSANGILRRKT